MATVKQGWSVKRIFESQVGAYFIKAMIVAACLTLVGKTAPFLFSVFLSLILVVYAVISTIGALYYTVINRLHKQHKLAESGHLSKLNRKWMWRMVGMLVVSFVSAFFFLLESPKWDDVEWLLIWIAVPLYYAVFLIVQRYLKKEYAPKFYKAHAMRWSFYIVGILLCLVYALLASLTPSTECSTFLEAYQSASMPYESAPSALMGEVGKLSSLSDAITEYGISKVTGSYFAIAFIARIVIYASVFFGLVNLFGFCLLNRVEVKSEFQILPADDEHDASAPILKRYVIAIVAVSMVVMAIFLSFEFETAKTRATSEHTVIDAFVDDQIKHISNMLDIQPLFEEYAKKEESLQREREEKLTLLIGEYYDRCASNIDSYLQWCDGPAGLFAKLTKPLSNPNIVSIFKERITEGSDSSGIENAYGDYQAKLNELREEFLKQPPVEEYCRLFGTYPDVTMSPVDNEGVGLWEVLDLEDDERDSMVNDVLLNTDGNLDREETKSRIRDLIERARAEALSRVKADGEAS